MLDPKHPTFLKTQDPPSPSHCFCAVVVIYFLSLTASGLTAFQEQQRALLLSSQINQISSCNFGMFELPMCQKSDEANLRFCLSTYWFWRSLFTQHTEKALCTLYKDAHLPQFSVISVGKIQWGQFGVFTTCWESEYDYTDPKLLTYAKLTVCSLRNTHYSQGDKTGPWQIQVSNKSKCGSKAEKAEKKWPQNFLDSTPSQETSVLPVYSQSQLRI